MIPIGSKPAQALRFGTRGSALALAQTALVADLLQQISPDTAVETVVIATEGDLDKVSPLAEIGGRGVFTNALEQAIAAGFVDAAVHCAKDLPTALPADLPLVAFPLRADPRDVLVSRHHTTLDRLPPNPVIGTSSRRRAVQVLRMRPDARIENLRGNIDSRLRKAESDTYDAIVLAAAGLERMGWLDRVCQVFSIEEMVPSPGQGAITLQSAPGNWFMAPLTRLDDPQVSLAVTIERAFLAAIGAGCTMPVGANAVREGDAFRLIAILADDLGERVAYADEPLQPGDEMVQAREIALRMQRSIGSAANASAWQGWGELRGARIAVTRPARQAGKLMAALADRGAIPLPMPTIRVEPVADNRCLDAALQAASRDAYDWMIFASANAAEVVGQRLEALGISGANLSGVEVAAVGEATSAALREIGLPVSLVPDVATGEGLGAALRLRKLTGVRILFPRSSLGGDQLPASLRAAGAVVDVVEAYRTVPELALAPEVLGQLRRGEVDAIAFSSPSSVVSLLALLGDERGVVSPIPAVCAGPVTAHAAREAGLHVAAVSSDPGATAMADAIVVHWRERQHRSETPMDGKLMHAHQAMERNVQ